MGHPPALLFLVRCPASKRCRPGLERRLQMQHDAAGAEVLYLPQKHAAFLAEAGMDQSLIIVPPNQPV